MQATNIIQRSFVDFFADFGGGAITVAMLVLDADGEKHSAPTL
jgi:hypothetical protein